MARKRMFDSEIVSQDKFIDLSIEAKAIYFLLGIDADDEGFISPKKVLRIHGETEKILKELIDSNFIIQFDSGVVLIVDWHRNNYLDHNRIKETIYLDEKKQVTYDKNNYKYVLLTDVKQLLNQNSIDENSIEEYSQEEKKIEEKREEEVSVYVMSPTDVMCKEIIDYLNQKVYADFKWDNPKTKELINERLNEGYKVADFKIVIDKKAFDWKGTEFEKYLVPRTLFGDKFESYLEQKVNKSILDMSMDEIDYYFGNENIK